MSARLATSDRAAARRAMGPAAVLPVAEAAALLPLGDREARDWLDARRLVLTLRGRDVVIWGDVLDALRREATAEVAPAPRSGGRLPRVSLG